MYKRITTIFIIFFVLCICSIFLIIFLKFDNYSPAYLFKKENYTFISLNKDEFQKLDNKKYVTFKLNQTIYETKVLSYSYQKNYCFLTLNEQINEMHDMCKINLFINRSNLFGWEF